MGTWTVVVAFAGVGRSRLCVRACVSEHVSVCVWVWVCKRARLRVCVGGGCVRGGVVQSGARGTFSGGAQRAAGGLCLKLEINV